MTVRLDAAAIEALDNSSAVRDILDSVGEQVAERARQAAPKSTGEGAASITHEIVNDNGRLASRVSWDNDHFYMLFVELGTSRVPARPFLRPALDGSYTP